MSSMTLTPELTEALCGFCDIETLKMRSHFCDELTDYFLEDDGVDDHQARDYARTLRIMKQDLDRILSNINQTQEP